MATMAQVLLRLGETGGTQILRMTTLNKNFVYDSEIYHANGAIESIAYPEHVFGSDDATLSFSVSMAALAAVGVDRPYIEAFGPATCRLLIIKSTDGGKTWDTGDADIVYRFTGRMSRTTIESGLWVTEAHPVLVNRLKLNERWTADDQRQSVVGGKADKGLDFVAELPVKEFSWPFGTEENRKKAHEVFDG